VTEPQSMGDYLRAARRRRRVSIERAAEDTKIRADFLMRMESDEFDFLAAAYVRGFLKNYARYLRVDPEPLLTELDRRLGSRVDTAQIIAAERRRKTRRRAGYAERRQLSNWVIAALVATMALVTLAVIGSANQPSGERPRNERVAGENGGGERREEQDRQPAPEDTESPTPEPSVTETPEEEDALALADGIELTVAATRANCWMDVTVDGQSSPIFSETLLVGETETFTAEEEMTIIFGFPEGVDITVNGKNLGAPGDANPITIQLPDDVESL
jgi:cytoskeletal protein RodZ